MATPILELPQRGILLTLAAGEYHAIMGLGMAGAVFALIQIASRAGRGWKLDEEGTAGRMVIGQHG